MNSKNVFDERGAKVRLDDISAEPPGDVTREKAEKRFEGLGDELFDLQDMMWGAKLHSVLVVLQGRDAAGKDGTIKHVVGSLNPRGVQVVSFGVPTPEEREHDFLWRVHRHAPRLGEFSIFNRSHYEDVLVVRVHDLVPKKVWKERYDHIAGFESLLAQHDTIVLKFFLHITPKEQKKRLLEREEDPRRVEAERRRLAGARALGRLHRSLRGRDLQDGSQARAVDRRAREREVVPQPGRRGVDRGCAAPLPRGMAREAQGHRQGATRGGTRIPQRVGRMACPVAPRAAIRNSAFISIVSTRYEGNAVAACAVARVQEGPARRALPEALPAPRAPAACDVEEGALSRFRSRRDRYRHRHLSDPGYSGRPHHPLRHRRDGPGVVVWGPCARLAGR